MADAQSPPISNDDRSVDADANVKADDVENLQQKADSMSPDDSVDSALLDEEEAPLEIGEADKVVTPSKKAYGGRGAGYNALKSHEGQLYSGMAIGGSHTWNYEPGVWKETKEEPDLWRIDYRTNKRRARNAPKGSGAPVGTEYHWLIVGHQACASSMSKERLGQLTEYSLCGKSTPIPTRRTCRDPSISWHISPSRQGPGRFPLLRVNESERSSCLRMRNGG